MITVELDNFSLKQICESGQCFRMRETEETDTYELIAGDKYLKMSQQGSIVNFYCSDMEFICYWVPYFDIDADYSRYIEKINPRDSYLRKAAECGSGIRILRQDLWETIITFLISQQNNIARIRGCIDRLCARYGEKLETDGRELYAFPTPENLACATETELRELGMGYRARYIVDTTRSILEGDVSLEKLYQMKYYRNARKELMRLSGVGEKVADCICLFALHHMDAFPVDTHIRQVLDEHYRRGFPNRRYHGIRGIIQQYIFYYELVCRE
ncbi:DNA-3-methyladenine glycosylase family protein [Blautia sp. MSJ-19]|uniref:DNA-3-methyladenine glycosylase family protein n=1 Tax=Blautia sp. MSJ-19 TaxID=2841517 RepID=UPI001C0F017A|nr:DNA glycosylase [Blautia sp. MSJ-19]MBU5480807.1 8-oxoguanine DNA glycosylase [Blautia sp. MSJ-19]